MSEATFSDFINRERERLHAERDRVIAQQKELETKLAEIARELQAVDAYEAAKTRKSVAQPRQAHGGRASVHSGQRGSKREALLAVIRENPAGLRRGEILERMGLKGDKSGEMSVSNALTALTKGGQVTREDGKYRAG